MVQSNENKRPNYTSKFGLVNIMSDEEKRNRLLELAKRDMNIFKEKYKELKELSKVFESMDEILNN